MRRRWRGEHHGIDFTGGNGVFEGVDEPEAMVLCKALDLRSRVTADPDGKPEMRTGRGRFDQGLSPPAESNDRSANHRPLLVGGQGNVFNAPPPNTEDR